MLNTWVDNIKENLTKSFSSKGMKTKLIIIIGIVGILLILLSEISFSFNSETNEKSNENYNTYVSETEKELTNIISSIEGVGKCKVMITLKDSSENIYAKNSENQKGNSSYSENDEYVIYDGENGDSPILIKKKLPNIEGVVVVCSGGDNIAVKEQIIKCVSVLFNISSNRISVSKICM